MDKKRFPSAISLPVVVVFFLVFAILIYFMALDKAWFWVATMVITGWFGAQAFLSTSYTFSGNVLHIKSGLIYNRKLEISSIRKISKSSRLLSSPAASINRLSLIFNKFDEVLVSPQDKIGFVKKLLEINPEIEVDKNVQIP